MRHYIGIDIGGTSIEGVLVNQQLKVLKHIKKLTQAHKNRNEITGNILSVINSLRNRHIHGIGVGVPGFADAQGKIQLTPNIPEFENFNLKHVLEKKLRHIVHLENDAHCFILAEHLAGAAKGMKNVLGITLGTGVGGGAILDGRLYKGSHGAAAHFGHMIIDPKGVSCDCGQSGDLEAWCGGKCMALRYLALSGKSITAKEIFKLALGTNKGPAHTIINEFYQYLGVAIGNLINTFNPEAIVLGGGISNVVEISKLRKSALKYGHTLLVSQTKIIKNKLGASAGVLGAACLPLHP